jgi:hypothetical protein
MSIIRVYAPDQSPESKGSGPNTAAAVMGAMLAKASEPIEMLPAKPAKAKTEKTRAGNPNRLTLRQHVFPAKSIGRFGNQNGLISVHDLVRKRVFSAKPTNAIFCADRAWDQRTESQMTIIEDKFQSLIAPVVAGLSRTIPQDQRAVVNQMYALWFMRPRYRELTQQEIHLHGGVGSKLSKEQEENLETNGYLFARKGGAMPARQLNGLQIMLRVYGYARDLGRSDELFEQNCNSGEDDEASVIHEEFVVSGCDTAELFEFVEEPLDEIAFPIERFVIVDWGSAV